MAEQDVVSFRLQYDAWLADRLEGRVDIKPFEFFCADQFLKDRSLSDSEVLSGQVDAKDDGGVDAFYCFLNRSLLDDTTVINARAGGDVELKIFQVRENTGFSPNGIANLGRFLDDLLTFSREPENYIYRYHDKLTRLMSIFRTKFEKLRTRSHPNLIVELFYITRLDVEPHRNVVTAGDDVCKRAEAYYTKTQVLPLRYENAASLWTQINVDPPSQKSINLVEHFDTAEGWVGLANLRDYYEFLKDEKPRADGKPQIDQHIFHANVRGYQLSSPVNNRITKTLTASKKPEFWLRNNGITILTPNDASYHDKKLKIDTPRIVNGLQTSERIFDYFRDTNPPPDNRRILIRVIKTSDEETRSEVIRATNDQNSMPAEALISTLRIQHQIEICFKDNGLLYDRRKGHHKAQGEPIEKIVTILALMQAVIAILLRKPDDARGRPRDYLKDKKRVLIFGGEDLEGNKPAHNLDLYLRCAQIMRRVDRYLDGLNLGSNTTLNIRFYVGLSSAIAGIRNAHCPPDKLIGLNVESDLTDDLIERQVRRVRRIYRQLGANDEAAKNKAMTAELLRLSINQYSPPHRGRLRR